MSQQKKNYAYSGDFMVYIPKNSTGIESGDVVVMPRKADPQSRANLGVLGRISPIASANDARLSVGVADSPFSTDTVGTTLYAAPTAKQAIPVYKKGVFQLAIVSTSGNAGDLIGYSSGASGAQLFDIVDKVSQAVGTLTKSFSGATANDVQYVKLIEKAEVGLDLAFYLDNRVLNDCTVKPISGATQSAVMIGYTFTGNREGQVVVLKGKYFRLTRDTTLTHAIGWTGGAASAWKAAMVVARSGGFAFRTCSGTKTTLATFLTSGMTAAYFTPLTQSSGEVAIGYVVFGSAITKATAGMIFNLRGISRLPVGNGFGL